MYSMVLMVAMTASPESASFGHKSYFGCNGGSCNGTVVTSTGCCGGMMLGSGCCGGLFSGKHAGMFGCCGGGLFSGHGCCGGGLFSGHGCCGGGLFSGHGCCGGGMFSGKHAGCCLFGGKMFHHGCNGCTGGAGCTGGSGCCGGTPAMTTPEKKDMPLPKGDKKPSVTSSPALITVNVPANATISIDGTATKSTSAVRVFATPALEAGTVYYYSITAEVVREGHKYTTTEKVAVESGAQVEITLNPNVTAEVASK